jgi:hypothetical protein
MKTYFLFFFGLIAFGGFVFQAQADSINDHLCAREIPLFTEGEYDAPCGETITTAETISGKVLTKEMTDFQTEDLAPLLQDNGSNSHFIAEEGIRRLRRHESCLRKICSNWFDNCARKTSKNLGRSTSNQAQWCDQKVDQLSQIARTELFTTATQNQTRKNRSLLSEKFRQISTRFRYYLHFWVNETIADFNFFKGKIDGTIKSPRQ